MLFKVNDIKKNEGISGGKSIKKNTGDASFAEYLNNISNSKSQQVSGTTVISVTDAIFAAQMINDEEEKQIRHKLIKRGFSLLDKLEEIRDAILLGYISKEKLIEISRMIKEHQVESSDPKLQEILSDIELRVEVELAKLTK